MDTRNQAEVVVFAFCTNCAKPVACVLPDGSAQTYTRILGRIRPICPDCSNRLGFTFTPWFSADYKAAKNAK